MSQSQSTVIEQPAVPAEKPDFLLNLVTDVEKQRAQRDKNQLLLQEP